MPVQGVRATRGSEAHTAGVEYLAFMLGRRLLHAPEITDVEYAVFYCCIAVKGIAVLSVAKTGLRKRLSCHPIAIRRWLNADIPLSITRIRLEVHICRTKSLFKREIQAYRSPPHCCSSATSCNI